MGLPSKKQLHQHKRGARKAQDTLEALDQADDAAKMESEVVEELIEKKKSRSAVEKDQDKREPIELEMSGVSRKRMENNEAGTKTDEMIDLKEEPVIREEQTRADSGELATVTYDEENEDTQKDKYLTFRLAEESYAVPISHVTEIIVIQRITEVPDTPPFVKGVINLRGQVIPVIDVRLRFHMEFRDYDDRTCIIVVECQETFVGLIVDTVKEVVDIPEAETDPPPRSHSGIESSYIQGMGKVGKQVNIILDIEKVLFVEELLQRQRDIVE